MVTATQWAGYVLAKSAISPVTIPRLLHLDGMVVAHRATLVLMVPAGTLSHITIFLVSDLPPQWRVGILRLW